MTGDTDETLAKQFKQRWEKFYKTRKYYVGSIDILHEVTLSCSARMLFFIISSISYKVGFCHATNKQLAERLGLKETMVKTYLKELVNCGYVYLRFADTEQGVRRRIMIDFETIEGRYLDKSTPLKKSKEWMSTRIFKENLAKKTAANREMEEDDE